MPETDGNWRPIQGNDGTWHAVRRYVTPADPDHGVDAPGVGREVDCLATFENEEDCQLRCLDLFNLQETGEA
jgi:hypothetical protein